jgi:hypothetical protein
MHLKNIGTVLVAIFIAQSVPVGGHETGQPLAMHWGSDWRKMTREVCATKAVEAMGNKENFITAEINNEGDVFGVTEHAACVVYTVPIRGGVEIYVVVAGRDSKEVERLRNAIRAHVFDGPYDPKVPRKIVSKDAKRRSAAPALHLGGDTRNLSRADFDTAAKLSMERQGMNTAVNPKTFTVSGARANGEAVAFYLETKPGTGFISVVGASYDSRSAEYLRNTVREDIFSKKLPKPWAVILCKFSDLPNYEPHPPSFYREAFTELGAGKGREFDYFRQVSYGALDMTGSKVFGWYTMPNHKTKDLATLKYPNPGRSTLHDWGVEVARAHNIDLKPFHGVVVVFNTGTDAGSAGGHRVVLGYAKDDWSPTFNLHELGHGFDLNHSWRARPDVEYGDQWDIMSAMNVWTFRNKYGDNGPGMNACNLKHLGAIPAGRIWTSTGKPGNTTITLAALHRPEADGYLMASIPPAAGSKSKTSYVVEFRQKQAWDAGLPADTVLVHEVRDNGLCYLLSRIERADPASIQVLAGQSFTVAERKLTVHALSFDAAASTAKVTVTISN